MHYGRTRLLLAELALTLGLVYMTPARADGIASEVGTPAYMVLSGTGMAAPQVASVVALMLQANPSLDPNTVKGILMFTAHRLAL